MCLCASLDFMIRVQQSQKTGFDPKGFLWDRRPQNPKKKQNKNTTKNQLSGISVFVFTFDWNDDDAGVVAVKQADQVRIS
jgi:hypothetical protein